MEPPIEISLTALGETIGYDVDIYAENTTIAQYIAAMDAFLEEKIAPCLGCDSCCYERIPLTLGDVYKYGAASEAEIIAFIKKYCEFLPIGQALDVKLRQKEDSACIFLDKEKQKCRNHPQRSLVCHTYICLPQTEEAAALRSALVNEGEDALIGKLLGPGLQEHWAQDIGARQEDYPSMPLWEGHTYEEIRIRDIISTELWEKLYRSKEK